MEGRRKSLRGCVATTNGRKVRAIDRRRESQGEVNAGWMKSWGLPGWSRAEEINVDCCTCRWKTLTHDTTQCGPVSNGGADFRSMPHGTTHRIFSASEYGAASSRCNHCRGYLAYAGDSSRVKVPGTDDIVTGSGEMQHRFWQPKLSIDAWT